VPAATEQHGSLALYLSSAAAVTQQWLALVFAVTELQAGTWLRERSDASLLYTCGI
jgi:hypothetical protein